MIELIFSLVGGLGLFIYGIWAMGDGLQKVAGDTMKKILEKLTSNRVMGVAIGTAVTSIIQSSSATTVIVVGFVNAGLMTLMQAISVIIGANIGTTITGQIVAFKLTKYALPIIALGTGLLLFSKKKSHKNFGQFLFGFGILFLGLNIMTGAIEPYSDSETLKNIFLQFGKNPILGILTGMIVTGIVQSSSVTIGMTITLAGLGLLPIGSAIPIILGDNIGTCVTALLASINTNRNARRAALGHIMFNVIGTVIVLCLLPFYMKLILVTATDPSRQVANAHTLFNVLNALLFLPFIPLYTKLLVKIIPIKKEEKEAGVKYLDKRLLITPAIALSSARKEILRMMHICNKIFNDSMQVLLYGKFKFVRAIRSGEEETDMLQKEISKYLVEITTRENTMSESYILPSLIHTVNDLERIGDHCINIVELTETLQDKKLKFSKQATKEILVMRKILNTMFEDVISCLRDENLNRARHALKIEEEINKFTIACKDNHCARLKTRLCSVEAGFIYNDLLANFEKIGDHLTNIAEAKLRSVADINSI